MNQFHVAELFSIDSAKKNFMKSLFAFLASMIFSLQIIAQDCSTINVTTGLQSISASGVAAAPIVGMQVFNSGWATVASQTFTGAHGDVVTIGLIPPGNYFVNVRFYNTSWGIICEKGFNVTVNMTEPPPPDTCTLTFQKTFGTAIGDEYPFDMVKTTDGGYVVAGMATSSGNTNHDALLMKFDSRGNLLWSKTYGGGQEDYFYTLSATTGGGIIAAGSFNATGSTGFETYSGEAWLVKLDGSGNIEWQKKYTDNANPGRVHDVIQTTDGGYGLIGDFPFTPGPADMMIIKTNSTGVIQWQKKVGVESTDDGLSIVEDGNGGAGLIVTGNNYSATNYDGVIVKLDLANGNVLWSKSYDLDSRTNRFTNITKVNDGFVISAVTHDGWFRDNAVHVLIKTDFNGNIVLAKEVRAPGCGDGHLTVLNDGGYFFVEGEDAGSQNTDVHMIRTDANGNVLWSKKYPRAGLQWIQKIITDGYYVVGVGYNNTGGLNDAFLIKTHISGRQSNCTSVDETATTRTPVVTNMGSPFTVNASLSLSTVNTSSSPVPVTIPATMLCVDSCGSPPPPPTQPQIVLNGETIYENIGTARFHVCLSTTSTQTVTVQYSTANGTAIAGSDYTAVSSGLVTIPAGQTCGDALVTILDDMVPENSETFSIILSNPTNATLATSTATIRINDDDTTAQGSCNSITINPGNNQITVGGVNAPVATVQIFNSSWASVYNQTYTNSPGTVNIPIVQGTYHVKVTFYTSNWSLICDKNQDVTVVNQCPAGTICISNVCPAQAVNLNNAYSIPNLPAGTTVSWHTGTPATDANRLTPSQAQNVTTSGTYYATINISGANCYSNTIPVTVTIIPCNGSSANTSLQVKSTDMSDGSRITAFPNPFTHSVKVIIPSSKNERATIDVVDMMGRSLKAMPVQLVRGTNQVTVDGLEKYPSGSYLIRVKLADRIETLKVLRQQ